MPFQTTAAHGLSVVDVRRYAESFILVLQFTESGTNQPFKLLVDASADELLDLVHRVGADVLDDFDGGGFGEAPARAAGRSAQRSRPGGLPDLPVFG